MRYGRLSIWAACWVACWAAGTVDGAAPSRPPNFVVLLADDLGWADLGCYGADLHETPRIDRLAAQGVRFTDAYAAAPVCTPTRASVMTGKYPARLHMTIWREASRRPPQGRPLTPPTTVSDLPHDETTIAEALRAEGYACAHVGKWHLGGADHFPETMGFDVNIGATHWGAPASFWWPYSGPSFGDPFRYVPHLEGGRPGQYLTDRLTSEAVAIMERWRDRPFFLYLAWHAVHTPIEGKPEWSARFRHKLRPTFHHQNPDYAAMVATLDGNVGRILDALDRLQLSEHTVVLFASDNGGYINRYRGRPVTSNAPLRSGKGSLYEGGIRTPLIVRWPGRAPAGAVCTAPVISNDFYATILQIAGVHGASEPEDSRSLVPWLRRPASAPPDRPLFFHYPHYYATTTPVSAVRRGRWKLLHYYEDDHVELYDLETDLGERRNVAAERPETAGRLRAALDGWLRAVNAQLPARRG